MQLEIMLFGILFLSIMWVTSATENGTCPKLLRELADKQSRLVYCITSKSVPVTMCISCKGEHENVSIAYDSLVKDCTQMYFDKDRINIVASTESVLTGLWSKAYCDDCFNNNNSIVFNAKNESLYDCLAHTKNPCEECEPQYSELNQFYKSLDERNNGEVCYDIQDSMNRTRKMWSKEKKCCCREYNMTLFTVAICITLCLPVIFYGSTYFLTRYQERNHGLLNDEDPHDSSPSLPGSSNMNISNSLSVSTINNLSTTNETILPRKTFDKNNFNILNDDSESSDDEPLTLTTDNFKGKIK